MVNSVPELRHEPAKENKWAPDGQCVISEDSFDKVPLLTYVVIARRSHSNGSPHTTKKVR